MLENLVLKKQGLARRKVQPREPEASEDAAEQKGSAPPSEDAVEQKGSVPPSNVYYPCGALLGSAFFFFFTTGTASVLANWRCPVFTSRARFTRSAGTNTTCIRVI